MEKKDKKKPGGKRPNSGRPSTKSKTVNVRVGEESKSYIDEVSEKTGKSVRDAADYIILSHKNKKEIEDENNRN